MKPMESGHLTDITNMIKEYMNRKKPHPRKPLAKTNGPTLVLDIQSKRPNSNIRSYQTLQIKSRVRQTIQSRCLPEAKSKERELSVQINRSKEKHNHQSFRILKSRSRMPAALMSLVPRKHYMSVEEPRASLTLIRQRYLVESTIKQGLNSIVYRCKDTLKETQVALKMFHSVSETNQLKMIRYLDHRNLIKYQNYFIDQDKLYFSMELYPSNLFQFIFNNGIKYTRGVAKEIFKQICDGIQHLHSSDFAHCNLKLQHVLIKKEERLKIVIIDFNNMVKCKDEQKMSKRQLIKNPNYAAPQLFMDKAYCPKLADCWALGIILYALLTGRLPFRSKEQSQLERKIRRGKLCFPEDVSPEERSLIQSILTVDPAQRLTLKQILHSELLN